MRISYIAILFILLAFLQWVFINSPFGALRRLDLFLLGAIFFALNNKRVFAVSMAVALGLTKDIFCANHIFFNTAYFGLAGFYIAGLSGKLYKDSWVAQAILTLGASFFAFLGLWGALCFLRQAPPFFEALRYVIVPSAVATAFFAPIFFTPLNRLRIKIRA